MIIGDPLFSDIPFLILANKHDLKEVLPLGELCKFLGLYNFKESIWHIQYCSALMGEGLYEGIEWLVAASRETKAPKRNKHHVLEGIIEVAQHTDATSLFLDVDLVNTKYNVGCKAALTVDTGFSNAILLSKKAAFDLRLEPKTIYDRQFVDASDHKHHGIGFGKLQCDLLSLEGDDRERIKSKEVDVVVFKRPNDTDWECSKSKDDWQRELFEDWGIKQPILWVSPIKNGFDSNGEQCLFGLKAMESLNLGIHPDTGRLITRLSS